MQAELESRTEEEVAELEAAVLKALPQVSQSKAQYCRGVLGCWPPAQQPRWLVCTCLHRRHTLCQLSPLLLPYHSDCNRRPSWWRPTKQR